MLLLLVSNRFGGDVDERRHRDFRQFGISGTLPPRQSTSVARKALIPLTFRCSQIQYLCCTLLLRAEDGLHFSRRLYDKHTIVWLS